MLVHASCVSIDGQAVLLRGPSGSGKSDLALRLIDTGAVLVADDQVILKIAANSLMASAPRAISGLLEVRGIGIVNCEVIASAPIRLVIDLDSVSTIERLPNAEVCSLLGFESARITLNPFEASAAAKVRIALREVV